MPRTAAITRLRLVFSLIALLFFTSCSTSYQHSNFQPDAVDVASVRFSCNMYKFVQVAVPEKKSITDEDLPKLKITDSLPPAWRNRFPPDVIEKELILK